MTPPVPAGTNRVAVVGGGIAGLAAAHRLTLDRPDLDVTIFEASGRLGGRILTTPFAGLDLDAGPDAFLARVPWAVDLCTELGLADELVSPATRTAYVYWDGELHRLPAGLILGVPTDFSAVAESPLLGPEVAERVKQELTLGGEVPVEDESVGSFIRRRLGDEVLERLVGPLLGGINAGDADRLSLHSGALQISAAAAQGGSLIEALRGQQARATADPDAPIFYTLPGGLGRLIAVLGEQLRSRLGPDKIRLNAAVESIRRGDDKVFRLSVGGQSLDFDAIVMAAPAPTAGTLLGDVAPRTAAGLAAIDYSSVALVSLHLAADRITRALDASGFLVPKAAGLLLTACSWTSTKFSHLQPNDGVLVRASAGRYGDTRFEDMDDGELVDALVADLTTTMGLREGPPEEVRVTRWPSSFPQYTPGHGERVETLTSDLAAEAPGVLLAGAAYRGVGIPACIRDGSDAARAISTFLNASTR